MSSGLVVALAITVGFAVTNGLHDASNAIAALVATRAATPLQAIQTATLNASQALGGEWTHDVGQVAVGRFGDLVGVKGDPLSDVTVLEHPVFVMKGGEGVRRAP